MDGKVKKITFMIELSSMKQQLVLFGLKSSPSADETIMAKAWIEDLLWDLACSEIKHIWSDNGKYTDDVFQEVCALKCQYQSLSCIDAHHQNACAKHAIHILI